MIPERFFRKFVFPEAFVPGFIVLDKSLSCPILVTLDPEMIVGSSCQRTPSGIGFENSLCEGDACRDAVFHHLPHRNGTEFHDVFTNQFIIIFSLRKSMHAEKDGKTKKHGSKNRLIYKSVGWNPPPHH
jgi:hypothetical protein